MGVGGHPGSNLVVKTTSGMVSPNMHRPAEIGIFRIMKGLVTPFSTT
jgi:hypothetical protein